MTLSTRARYGVRAVFDIAFHGEGRPTQAKDIAGRQDVPLRYLEQIFQALRRAGLVESKRGPRGGYTLGRPAEQIRFGDVVRALQGPIDELLCVGESLPRGRPRLSREVPALAWRDLGARIAACFDELTIADLCARGDRLGLRRGSSAANMYFI